METSKLVPNRIKSQVSKMLSVQDDTALCCCVVCTSVHFQGLLNAHVSKWLWHEV